MKLGLNLAIPGIAAQQGKVAQRAYHRAVFQLDARRNPSSGAPTDLSANALAVQNGSAAGADENDVLFLPYTGERYVYLPGGTGNSLSAPDEAAFDITGDVELVVRAAATDWTPSAFCGLLDKVGGNAGYGLRQNTNGTLFVAFGDGSAFGTSLISTAAPPLVDGAAHWLKATFQPNNGAGGKTARFFYAADQPTEPTAWTEIGTPVVQATAIAIGTNTVPLHIGAINPSANPFTGNVYRAIVRNGIDGTVVFDWSADDAVNATHTEFTAATGQTVTVNRATSGRKTVVVEANKWLLGTNDYIEVADNALLDIGASDNFTVLAVLRRHANPVASASIVSKKIDTSNTATAGWTLRHSSGAPVRSTFTISDGVTGTSGALDSGEEHTPGELNVTAGVKTFAGDEVLVWENGAYGTTSPVDPTGALTLANAEAVRIGRLSGAGANYNDFELYAVYVWREALSASELAAIAADWGAA